MSDDFKENLDRLTPLETVVQVTAFYQILHGKMPNIEELSTLTGLTREQVEFNKQSLLKKGLLVNDYKGDIVGSHGLSLVPSEHRLHINGQDLFTWCAFDAIGIPAALSMDAKISSSCFQCHNPVEITMVKGDVQRSSNEDICIWVVEVDIGQSIIRYS